MPSTSHCVPHKHVVVLVSMPSLQGKSRKRVSVHVLVMKNCIMIGMNFSLKLSKSIVLSVASIYV